MSSYTPFQHGISTSILLRKAGWLGEHLYAVHELSEDGGRTYREPTEEEVQLLYQMPGPVEVPSVDLDWNGVRHIWSLQYGTTTTADLHSRRQLTALSTLVGEVRRCIDELEGG